MAPWVEAVLSQRRTHFMTAAAARLLKVGRVFLYHRYRVKYGCYITWRLACAGRKRTGKVQCARVCTAGVQVRYSPVRLVRRV